ncbi:MAG: hypothetical protein JW940_15715 [Polyangiaceae bacterium]|nr:hypothetical protein [Polyangiaceae bacterium]
MTGAELKGSPLPLVDGESVYCLNQTQLREARRLVFSEPASCRRLGPELARLEETFDRNERAALAFVLIDRLLGDVSRR